MKKKSRHRSLFVRRSCLTGKAVWLYYGPSSVAEAKAYRRACERELRRVGDWYERASRRRSNIMRLLGDCMENIPIMGILTDEQIAANRSLLAIVKENEIPYSDFYSHIVEENRRRREKSARWRKK